MRTERALASNLTLASLVALVSFWAAPRADAQTSPVIVGPCSFDHLPDGQVWIACRTADGGSWFAPYRQTGGNPPDSSDGAVRNKSDAVGTGSKDANAVGRVNNGSGAAGPGGNGNLGKEVLQQGRPDFLSPNLGELQRLAGRPPDSIHWINLANRMIAEAEVPYVEKVPQTQHIDCDSGASAFDVDTGRPIVEISSDWLAEPPTRSPLIKHFELTAKNYGQVYRGGFEENVQLVGTLNLVLPRELKADSAQLAAVKAATDRLEKLQGDCTNATRDPRGKGIKRLQNGLLFARGASAVNARLNVTVSAKSEAEGAALRKLGIAAAESDSADARSNIPWGDVASLTYLQLRYYENRLLNAEANTPQGVQARVIGLDAIDGGFRAIGKGENELADSYLLVARTMLDIAVSLYPPTAFARDCYELLTGLDALTGERLTPFQRGIAMVGVATVGLASSAALIAKASKALIAAREGEQVALAVSRAVDGATAAARYAQSEQSAQVIRKMISSDGSLRLSGTVEKQLINPRRSLKIQSILDTVGIGTRVPDPQGAVGRFMYRARAQRFVEDLVGNKRWSSGTLEVLVDEGTGTVEHVQYMSH